MGSREVGGGKVLRVRGGSSIDDVPRVGGNRIGRERIGAKGLFLDSRFRIESCLLKGPPLVVFLVAFTGNIPFLALNTGGFGLVTL